MLWKFRRQKVAMASLAVVVLLYLVAIFAEFLAPYGTDMTRPQYTYAPPQGISLFLVGAGRILAVPAACLGLQDHRR